MANITRKFMRDIGFSVCDAKNGWIASKGDFRMYRRQVSPRAWTFGQYSGNVAIKAFTIKHITTERFNSIIKAMEIKI